MPDRLTQLAEDASAGLRDDPELQLEVRAELLSRLEAMAQAQAANGADEVEAIEQAVAEFGSPQEVAGKLLAANRARMKRRALARLALRVLLAPILVTALLVSYWQSTLSNRLRPNAGVLMGYNFIMPSFSDLVFRINRLEDLHQDSGLEFADTCYHFLFFIRLRPTSVERQKEEFGRLEQQHIGAFWNSQRHGPEAKEFAGYIAASRYQSRYLAANVMNEGERLDPQNALYNYIRASRYLEKGMKGASELRNKEPPNDSLLDQRQFDLGIRELRKGLVKPTLNCYHQYFIRKRLAMLPPPRLTDDYVVRKMIFASELLPFYSPLLKLTRKIPGCVRLLQAEGRQAEADFLLAHWYCISKQMLVNACWLLDLGIAERCGKTLGKETAAIYAKQGREQQAARIQRLTTNLLAIERRKEEHIHIHYIDFDYHMLLANPQASTMAALSFYTLKGFHPTPEELATTRYLEYTLAEEGFLGLFILLLLVCLLIMTGIMLFWRRMMSRSNKPLLLMIPSWRPALLIYGFGLVLPLVVYAVYTHFPVLCGRDIGLRFHILRFKVEMVIPGLLITFLPCYLTMRTLRQRCFKLGILRPQTFIELKGRLLRFLTLAVVLLTFDAVFIYNAWNVLYGYVWENAISGWIYNTLKTYANENEFPRVLLAAVIILLGLSGVILVRATRRLLKRKEPDNLTVCGQYYGTITRSLVVSFVPAILLLTLVIHPLLLNQEIKYLQADQILMPHIDTLSRTPFEDRMVRQLKAEMVKAVYEAEK